MNRTLQITCSCVFVLVLATACRRHRTREFVAVLPPVKFENWRLYVNALVDAANPAPTNRSYMISTVAWTALGDSIGGRANEFRPTAYDANMDSLRLFGIESTHSEPLPLQPLHHGSTDHPNRLVQMAPSNSVRIEIPASVNELRADVVMTFRHRETGKTETKVFTLPMRKRERTKLEPMSGSDLYVGGAFTYAGGNSANFVAKWNGSEWSALGSGVGPGFPQVRALAVSGSDLFVGGDFTTAGDKVSTSVAKANLEGSPPGFTSIVPTSSGTQVQLTFTAEPGVSLLLLNSTNLANWQTNSTVNATGVTNSVLINVTQPYEFFRLRRLP